jgi:transposase
VTDDLRVDLRTLSPAGQEAVRMRVMAAIDGGLDDERAASLFAVSTKSIGRWRVRREAGGAEGLRSGRPGRKHGEGRFLSESEEAAVRQTILEFTPDDLGLGGLLWTTGKVHAFIKAHFKVRFSHDGLIKLFKRLGLSFQRPDRRAREADPEAMRQWTSETYPAIRAKAKAQDAVVMFGDQVGARSGHLSGRTRKERGIELPRPPRRMMTARRRSVIRRNASVSWRWKWRS